MSEKKINTSGEEPFQDLPLPDAEASWKKMKKLLDEEDGGRRTPPFLVLRSCLPWGALLLLLGLAAGLYFYPPSTWGEKAEAEVEAKAEAEAEAEVKVEEREQRGAPIQPNSRNERGHASSIPDDRTATQGIPSTAGGANSEPGARSTDQRDQSMARSSATGSTGSTQAGKAKASVPTAGQRALAGRSAARTNSGKTGQAGASTPGANNPSSVAKTSGTTVPSDPASPVPAAGTGTVKSMDTVAAKKQATSGSDSSKAADSTSSSPAKKKTASTRKIVFSAGLGLQQGIPVSDQKTVPYSYYGRKSSLSDYIPSVWVKAQRGKFFLMGEFRYGAAQSVKEFAFSRKTTYDTALNSLTETSSRLMKTYYHQVPLTFNYYVKPNWSVGLGGMYSVFHGAITERVVQRTNLQTQAKSVTREIVPIRHFTDSFLYKTQVHLLLQTDYEWRRFSLGLRYAWDVQPFIRYTTPSGELKEEKNQSLQAILRFRLWRSK